MNESSSPHDPTDWPVTGSPTRIGRRRFIAGVGAVAGGTAAAMTMSGSQVAAISPGASSFAPLPKAERLADTREPATYPFTRVADNHIRVQVAGVHGVPASASAAVLTVTAVNWSAPNHLTVFPAGISVPTVSNLNMMPGDINANLVTVKIGSGGTVDVAGFVPCDMIVDVLGYYAPVSAAVSAGRFVGLPSAERAIDTRNLPGLLGDDSFITVDMTPYVPADASSAVVNLTTTDSVGPNYFTAVPYAVTTKPATSSLNVTRPGEIRAAGVIVPVTTVGSQRLIKVYSLHPAEIIVDVTGYFTSASSPSSTAGLFVPLTPERLVDSREPGQIGRMWPGWATEVKLPAAAAAEASAVVLNVTGVASRGAGYLTVSAARQPIPPTSNVNFSAPWQTVPNHVITPVTVTHGFQIFSSHGSHVIADLAGYYTGTPKIPQIAAHVNPPPPPAPPTWVLTIPALGLTSLVLTGDATRITDSGHSWHWAGTGFMGESGANVAMFAHRTEAGAPYRYLDYLEVGDEFHVQTGDARLYTYRMVRRDLTDAANSNILAATRFHPGTTLSLVACTVGHDRTKSRWPDIWAPTSLKYRIVVTGELVGWREV